MPEEQTVEENMPLDKQMDAAFGDMKEILGRIDERVRTVIDSQMHLTARFDKFMVSHTDLVERVARLESVLTGNNRSLDDVEAQHHAFRDRLLTVEHNQDSIDECEDFLKSLEKRVIELEHSSKFSAYKMSNWSGGASYVFDLVFKFVSMVGIAFVLYKFGLK
jgi:hypothetical protein